MVILHKQTDLFSMDVVVVAAVVAAGVIVAAAVVVVVVVVVVKSSLSIDCNFVLISKRLIDCPTTRAQCYKTFNVRNLQMFAISWSVCPRQGFPA
jgi:hypothetical protein